MTLYNSLPRKEYDRVCQGEYEKFSISNEETIDSGFTRFNAIVTRLKSLDLYYSCKNHVRKFLRALLLKWRAKVTTIEKFKDLATLPLDELIGNLKVYEMVLDNDGVASKTTKEKVNSLALKDKVTREQTSDDSDSQGGSDEDVGVEINLVIVVLGSKEAAVIALETKKSDSEDGNEPQNDATCLMAIGSQEVDSLKSNVSKLQDEALNFLKFKKSNIVLDDMLSRQKLSHDKEGLGFSKNVKTTSVCLKCDLLLDDWIMDSGCTKHMIGNRRLFTSYKVYDGGHVIFRRNIKGKVIDGVHSLRDPLAWAVELFGLQEPDLPEVASASPDYVPGRKEPEQAPPSPNYVPGPVYPEYLAPIDDKIVAEDQPYADYASPVALSPGYVANSDPGEDPADKGDDDDDDDSSDDDEEKEEASEEEEEHLAPTDSVVAPAVDPVPSSEETESFKMDESTATPPPPPPTNRTTPLGARISIRPQSSMPFPSEAEVKRLLPLPTPPSSPLISLSPPSTEECLARCLAAPALPSSPLPIVPHPYGSPNHVRAPRGFRAAMGRLRASSPSTHHPLHPSPPLPPLPSSLYLPPPVPTSLPLPSPPLPPLPASLFIPPPVDRREDIPEAKLPPRKRLCLTAPTSRYEVGESSTAARPTGDSTETVKEIAPTTLEGVNARVTELAEVHEEDTHDIYVVIEDAQDRQTHLS
ncbi:UBN2 domain-containing protein [Tanacetum coccineum]|uniref:UBN2 domain-containing protein n=1 Tax=Tanacetum coccineum TaxID=301880 RepID=A0ABQ5A1V5_9ASTR